MRKMNNAKVLTFCTVTVLGTLALFTLGFRYAAMPESVLQGCELPQSVQAFQKPLDLGGRYGKVSVAELVQYYVANPPQATTAGAAGGLAAPVSHFGGC